MDTRTDGYGCSCPTAELRPRERIVTAFSIVAIVATGVAALIAGILLAEVGFEILRWLNRRTPKTDRFWPKGVNRRGLY